MPLPAYSGTTLLINTTTYLFRNYTPYQHHYLCILELHILSTPIPAYPGTTQFTTQLPVYSGTTHFIITTTCLFRNYTSYQQHYLSLPELHISSTPAPYLFFCLFPSTVTLLPLFSFRTSLSFQLYPNSSPFDSYRVSRISFIFLTFPTSLDFSCLPLSHPSPYMSLTHCVVPLTLLQQFYLLMKTV